MAASREPQSGSGYDPEAILVGMPLVFKCAWCSSDRLDAGSKCFSSLTSAPPQRESALRSALQNVVRTLRSAASGRPEGLHYICFCNALEGPVQIVFRAAIVRGGLTMKGNSPYRLTTSLLLLAGVVLVAIDGGARLAGAQKPGAEDLEVVAVRPNFYMIAGAGGNIAVQIGPIGVILVDTGSTPMSDQVLLEIKRLTNRPIRYIINTSADADHTGGNEKLSKAGQTILGNQGSAGVSEEAYTNGGVASVLAHENVLARMSAPAGQASLPFAVWPTKSIAAKATRCISTATGFRCCTCPRRTPMATASCSSAGPM